MNNIEESIRLIRDSGIDYEFRTTIVPKLLKKEDIIKIGEWLKGAKRYAIQQFRPDITLDKDFQKEKPYPREKLREFADAVTQFFDEIEVRE